MAFLQHSTTMAALLVKARALNIEIGNLPAGSARYKLLSDEYDAIQSQIRALRGGINQQTWL